MSCQFFERDFSEQVTLFFFKSWKMQQVQNITFETKVILGRFFCFDLVDIIVDYSLVVCSHCNRIQWTLSRRWQTCTSFFLFCRENKKNAKCLKFNHPPRWNSNGYSRLVKKMQESIHNKEDIIVFRVPVCEHRSPCDLRLYHIAASELCVFSRHVRARGKRPAAIVVSTAPLLREEAKQIVTAFGSRNNVKFSQWV
jgi:hypothetical protein